MADGGVCLFEYYEQTNGAIGSVQHAELYRTTTRGFSFLICE